MSETANLNLMNFKQITNTLGADMQALEGFSRELNLTESADALRTLTDRINNDRFNVAILGEFRRGKSTLINALLNTPVLPTDVLPTTATLNRVTYGPTKLARVEFKDGHAEEIPLEQLKDYVTKLTDESAERAKTVQEAVVYFPTNFCRNNVDLIDTPGLNDEQAVTDVTYSVIPKVDAAIFVIMPGAPFSMSEEEFLEKKLLTADVGRVLFVVTRMDEYTPEEQTRLLEHIGGSIRTKLLKKAEQVLADDPAALDTFRRKLGELKVIGVSSQQAMKAREANDEAMLAKSGFPVFESELERLLTMERGVITLQQQTNRILAAASDLYQAIQIRTSAMSLNEDEFRSRCGKAEAEIAGVKENKRREFARLDGAREQLVRSLAPMAQQYWDSQRAEAAAIIERESVTREDIAEGALSDTQQRLQDKIRSSCERASQLYAERIQNAINASLGQEIDRMADFTASVTEAFQRIQGVFEIDTTMRGQQNPMVATVLNYFTLGGGSGFSGYKMAGWKGAVLGGLSGGAATLASGAALGALIGLIGLPVTWPLVIIGGLAASAIGAFTGKKAVLHFLPDRRIEQFKSEYKAKITEAIDRMQKESDLSAQICSQAQEAFEALKAKVSADIDATLSGVQQTLDDVRRDFSTRKAEQEQKAARYAAILESAKGIGERSLAVQEQLKTLAEKA